MRRRSGSRLFVRGVLGVLGLKIILLAVLAMDMGAGFPSRPSDLASTAQAQEGESTSGQNGRMPSPAVDDFLKSLQERRFEQLLEREKNAEQATAKAEEERKRLEEVKGQLGAMLNELKQLKAQVDETLRKKNEEEEETLNRLAKVYEETTPEKAGPMISALSPSMAAKLLIRMNPRKAGRIWGHVDPKRGEAISKELLKLKE
jgi:flagellar motility protein MotE (MotC chaperone)